MRVLTTIAATFAAASLAWGFTRVLDHFVVVPAPEALRPVSVMRINTVVAIPGTDLPAAALAPPAIGLQPDAPVALPATDADPTFDREDVVQPPLSDRDDRVSMDEPGLEPVTGPITEPDTGYPVRLLDRWGGDSESDLQPFPTAKWRPSPPDPAPQPDLQSSVANDAHFYNLPVSGVYR